MPIRLAVIDGHTLTRFGLAELVARQDDIQIVWECGSFADAHARVSADPPDVITVDVALPDGDGLQLARELRDRDDGLGIVVLTSQGEDDVLFRALDTGVSAFVAKTAPVEEVLGAIRHAAVAASSFTASGLAVAIARRHTTQGRFALSPRETEVLALLRDGLSIPAIAGTIFVSPSTAKTYVARLYEKLGATNRVQALMTAMHHGLIGFVALPVADEVRSEVAAAPDAAARRPRQARGPVSTGLGERRGIPTPRAGQDPLVRAPRTRQASPARAR